MLAGPSDGERNIESVNRTLRNETKTNAGELNSRVKREEDSKSPYDDWDFGGMKEATSM